MDKNRPHTAKFETQQIPQRTQLRRTQLLKHIDLSGKGLEIGPYGYPTVYKSEADISYLDWKTRDQLVAECSSPDEIDSIPETDYLVSSNDYRQYVPNTFDYIIANHVLEHVPDLIHWLSNITAMLNPNGVLFLALPDKKFTFDKYRQNTTLSHILNDFYEEVQTISQEHLLEQVIYYDLTVVGQPMVVTERLNRARIEAVLAEGFQPWMIGYHCHIFQSETVLDRLFKPLILMGYVDLDIIDFVPPKGIHYGEMMLIFKKTWPRLPDRPIDLPSFYECDFQEETNQMDKGQLDKDQSDKGQMDKGQLDIDKMEKVKSKNISSFIKKSKFAQKYLKPLVKKKGAGH
jgi:SAM-dependent methyltransferase